MEAPSGFEPLMEVLQTSALPLGDGAAASIAAESGLLITNRGSNCQGQNGRMPVGKQALRWSDKNGQTAQNFSLRHAIYGNDTPFQEGDQSHQVTTFPIDQDFTFDGGQFKKHLPVLTADALFDSRSLQQHFQGHDLPPPEC
jgi:hypothetical protein